MNQDSDAKSKAVYIRVSTPEQDPERQWNTISRQHDVNRDDLYADVEHGDVFTGRAGLEQLLGDAEQYDVVVIDELSRFGRATKVRDVVDELHDNGVTIEAVDIGLELIPEDQREEGDLMSIVSRIVYHVLVELAKYELEQIRRRTREGIRRAVEEGKHVGNPPRGYEVEEGFLNPISGEYDRITEFIREVNKGRAKAPTARFFGIDSTSYQSILENSDEYWGEEYVGDKIWRRRRVEVQNGERELPELPDE